MFQELFFLPQANEFNKSIHKAVLLLPKETASDVTSKLEYIQKHVHKEKIIFWAGGS